MRAKCWNEEQKTLIIERLRTNELGVQEKTWKREQAIEGSHPSFPFDALNY